MCSWSYEPSSAGPSSGPAGRMGELLAEDGVKHLRQEGVPVLHIIRRALWQHPVEQLHTEQKLRLLHPVEVS